MKKYLLENKLWRYIVTRITQNITWANQTWLLDNRRVLINPQKKILILSDIHIGYYSSLRKNGSYLPTYDKILLEKAIQSLLTDYNGYHWIIAGDIKHNHSTNLSHEEENELTNILHIISESNELTLLPGNHDTGLDQLMTDLHINCRLVDSYTYDTITITHNQDLLDQQSDKHFIIGHVHPIISLEHLKGSFIPIFAINNNLIILPAFNYVAGGFNIKKLYYKNEKRKNFTIYALGKQIYELGQVDELV